MQLRSVLLWVCYCFAATPSFAGTGPLQRVFHFPHDTSIQIPDDHPAYIQAFFRSGGRYTWKPVPGGHHRHNNSHHIRYQQYFKDIPVREGMIVLHLKDSYVTGLTGMYANVGNPTVAEGALSAVPQDAGSFLLPSGARELTNIPGSGWQWVMEDNGAGFRLVCEIHYLPENSLFRHTRRFDAETGRYEERGHTSCFADVTGTANTAYQGIKPVSCYSQPGGFTLKCTTKGQGIITKNLNHQMNYQQVTEFTDGDNVWYSLPGEADEFATDAHYCAERYYDFLFNAFGTNSLDGNGYRLTSYLNYGTSLSNAFWNGQAVVYGSVNPLTTLDIAGHEFTHGLIQKTAALQYHGQPGTLNEAISDMFGAALEYHTQPGSFNWLLGEQSGNVLRSMEDPAVYGQPAFYLGSQWYYGTGDNGGVHINSGFLNKWFQLLTDGGQGVNELGQSYGITGTGMEKSIAIVYQTLTSYLVNTSGFDDFRDYTLVSARDLFGTCSPEYVAVAKAWRAVGMPVHNPSQNHLVNEKLVTGTPIHEWLPVDNGYGLRTALGSQPAAPVTRPSVSVAPEPVTSWFACRGTASMTNERNSSLPNAVVHPNPATSVVQLRMEGFQEDHPADLTLFDTAGRLVRQVRVHSIFDTIDLSGLLPGTYLVTIRTGPVIRQEKLQVQQ